MEFQIAQSAWSNIFLSFALLLLGLSCLLLVRLMITLPRSKKRTVTCCVVAGFAFICGIGGTIFDQHEIDQTNTSFSQQLMNEYHASSSKTFDQIKHDFSKYNEASIVMTRDGKDTPVFVKNLGTKDNKTTVAFTVLDEKSLYPKQ